MAKYVEYNPKTFAEFLNLVLDAQSKSKNPLWFRGCGNSNYELIPSLYRHRKIRSIDKLIELEYRLLTRFNQRSIPFHNRNLDDVWFSLFFMQHYGIPTRLLDWTENPFIAFYFATAFAKYEIVSNKIKFINNAAVWILDPVIWNKHALRHESYDQGILTTTDEQIKGYKPISRYQPMNNLPVAIYGAHNSSRIVAQRGVFTIYGQNKVAMEELYISEKFPTDSLIKINLNKSKLIKMRKDILNNGITESVVFPDLEGLAKEIRRIFEFED